MLTIGRLAAAVGVEAKTLRYYDRVGLLPPTARTRAGYRLYNESAADRLRFIRQAKTLGIALADIRRILAVRDEGAAPCVHVVELLQRNVTELEGQITQIQRLRSDLRRLLHELERQIPPDAQGADDCPCFRVIAAFHKRKAGASKSHEH